MLFRLRSEYRPNKIDRVVGHLVSSELLSRVDVVQVVKPGRIERAVYVERGTTANEVIMPLLDKTDDCAPYFAVVLVPGWRRP